MIDLRQKLHTIPEHGFKEHKTRALLIETLMSFGIEKSDIKDCAETGMVVDLKGKGAPVKDDGPKVVALRADMDGLPIPENN